MERCIVLTLLALLLVVISTGCGGPTADAARPISGTSGKSGHDGPDARKAAVSAPTTYQTTGREISGSAGSEAGAKTSAVTARATTNRTADTQARSTIQAPPATTSRAGGTTAASSLPTRVVEAGRGPSPFVDEPRMSGGTGYEADSILAVRHGKHKGYERVVVDLGAGKMPAKKVPLWTLISPTGDGLLRVTFPSISATKVPDGRFGDSMVKSFHVVRAPEGGMFVDLFARSAFTYRVLELSDPARLVIDFVPSDAKLKVPLPASNGNTVLTKPRAGTKVEDLLVVSGYSRNPEATNTIILRDSSGKVLLRENVQGNDWSATWGYFETTLDPPPFTGKATLQVGAPSARDGSFEGISVPVMGSWSEAHCMGGY
ncbi:MAG: Gmad2 immunoglobulin-like domain-containing protein [Rubrobacteraceae bacterium]